MLELLKYFQYTLAQKQCNFKEIETKVAEKFGDLVYSDAIWSRNTLLMDALDTMDDNDGKQLMQHLRDVVEAECYAVVELYTFAMYEYMCRTNEWTEAGQDRVKLSMMRLLLSIPADREIFFSDYSAFDQLVDTKKKFYHLDQIPTDRLSQKINYPEIELIGRKFNHTQTEDVNNLLHIIQSPRRMMMGSQSKFKSFLFGLANTTKHGSHEIHYFYREEMRTPNNVSYIVAIVEQKQIAIRKEVCDYVFYNKWMPVLNQDTFQQEFMRTDEENVADSLKKATIRAFGAKEREEFLAMRSAFVERMMENLVHHELAHLAFKDCNFTQTELTLLEGISSQQESILSVMNEVITEWMILNKDIKGPIRNMVDTALKKDTRRAEQLLLMYMSDAWFLDTDTTFMFPYTYIMFTIFLRYIEPARQVDFLAMHQDFNRIFAFLTDWYRSVMGEVHLFVKKITYPLNGEVKTYKDIEADVKFITELMDTHVLKKKRDPKDKEGNFWINVFTQLNRISPTTLISVFDFLASKQTDLYRELMETFVSTEDRKTYGTDIHCYVIEKMKAVGFDVSTIANEPAGERYEGEFRDDKRNGHGIYTWPDGKRYEGEFRDNKENGHGILTWPDGERYEGTFSDDKMNGQGIFTWPDGERYEGAFSDDKMNGQGIFTWPDGERYEGAFSDDKANGHGIYTWPDGKRYEGEFRDGKKNGHGILTLPSGQRYEGTFSDDKANGHGILTLPNGQRYEGEFRDNEMIP